MDKLKHLIKASAKPFALLAILAVPVIIFCLDFLLSGDLIVPGDGDYITQTHEAARISLLEFGQFPWWNPWISGGVPLYANPQFGLFSVQSITTLIFGSVAGMKIAISFYFLLGFYGFYTLFTKSFRTPRITAALLAYIWTFGSFLVHRASGHYTFFTVQFFPIMLYFFLARHTIKRSWLYLGLTAGLMANSAAHNTTIMSFFVMAIFVAFGILDLSFGKKNTASFKVSVAVKKEELLLLAKAGAVFIVLAGHRLYYALSYASDFPREFTSPETTIGIPKAIYALFGPLRQFQNTPMHPVWSWQEASAYIGILTLGVFGIVLYIFLKQKKQRTSATLNPLFILVLAGGFFALGLGDVLGPLSPYRFLDLVPVVSEMRVATRWLFWCAMMILLYIGLYRGSKHRMLINILLLVTVVELFIGTRPFLASPYVIDPAQQDFVSGTVINQQRHYNVDRLGIDYDENLTENTQANVGQIVVGDALVDTRFAPPFGEYTNKCDSDEPGCSFILTNNAEVEEWTPNKITLRRTQPGVIRLNMNPGASWTVNGVYTFLELREVEANLSFGIADTEDETITLEYVPKYSHTWFWRKLF